MRTRTHARNRRKAHARRLGLLKGPIYCLRALSKLAMAARAYDYLLVSMCDVRYVYSMQRARQIYERMPLPNECAQRSPLAVAPLTLNGSVMRISIILCCTIAAIDSWQWPIVDSAAARYDEEIDPIFKLV